MSSVEIVVLTIAAVAVLVVLQTALAYRHDHERTLAGPREELSEVEARLDARKAETADVEEDLRKRREVLANIADKEAEVDALQRRRDDLLAEWAQLDARRQELADLQAETEGAWQEHQEARRDRDEALIELEKVQERLERAEDLDARIRSLTDERDRLTEAIDGLRSEAADLADAREKAERLRAKITDMERESARLSGDRDAAAAEAERLRSENAMSQSQLATARDESMQLAAELAARRDRVRELEAREADLKRRAPVTGEGSDHLDQLREPPEVLRQLARWREWSPADEADALRRVEQRIAAAGLTYHKRTLRAFHTAMKVNQTTQMAVLAGVSGTGKSQLPRQYASAMGIGFLQVPVQPRWDSPQDLMGFYNYIESRFRPTDMARALFNLDDVNNHVTIDVLRDRMLMILLDEMNLARVEYYFSDFLSRLESRPGPSDVGQAAFRKDAEIELEIPATEDSPSPRIFPGYNLLFAGTMNEDESTQALSDKVVDRANVMRFPAPTEIPGKPAETETETASPEEALSRRRWAGWIRSAEALSEAREARESVNKLLGVMREINRPFGHRLGNAIMAYVANYPDVDGGLDVRVPLADQVEMRLLPKLRGIDTERHASQIEDLRTIVRDDLGDGELADAIQKSFDDAHDGTGSFQWRGVLRG